MALKILNTLSSSVRWSMMSWMPCMPWIWSANVLYFSGSFSLTRNDSGRLFGPIDLTKSGESCHSSLKRLNACSRVS